MLFPNFVNVLFCWVQSSESLKCFVGLGSIFGEAIVSESTNPLSLWVWNFGQNNSSNKDKTYDANCFIIAWHLCHPELLLFWNILKPIAPLQDMCVPLCAIIILIRPSIIIYYSNTAEDKNKIVFRGWLKIVTSM